MKRLNFPFISFLLAVTLVSLSSCTDFLDIDPPDNRIGPETLFKDPKSILALVNNLYTTDGGITGASSNLAFFLDVAADDIEPSIQPGSYREIADNVYNAENDPLGRWKTAYSIIYTANNLLENLPKTKVLSERLLRQYQAEALFMRAYCHFHLVNLYGDVPLIKTTDPGVTINLPATPASEVWASVVEDIQDALEIVPSDFNDPGRANQWAMRAILARVNLYQKDWNKAELLANEVIEDSPFDWVTNLDEVFLPHSPSAIWVPNLGSFSSLFDQKVYIFSVAYIPLFGNPEMIARQGLINAFETGDQRLEKWMAKYGTLHAPYKYVNGFFSFTRPEQYIYLRMAEQYLIRAEARANQGNLIGPNSATSDLNIIRNRAGLGVTNATTMEDILDAIMQERRVELFAEGHRWFDLKRTGKIDNVLGALKNTWEPYKKHFPIPQEELNANPNLKPNW